MTLQANEITDPEERMEFLPALVGGSLPWSLAFEQLCFRLAEGMIDDYGGGQWTFVRICDEDGNQVTGFLHPEFDQDVEVASMNGSVEKMSGRHAGLCITLTALSHLSFSIYNREGETSETGVYVARQYHHLRDWLFTGEFNDDDPADNERIQPIIRILD